MRRDPFARTKLTRGIVHSKPIAMSSIEAGCDNCGGFSTVPNSKKLRLFRYTREHDGGRKEQIVGMSCCIDCMEAYYHPS